MDIVHCPPVHIQTQFVIVAIQNCQNCQNLSILRLIPRHHATFACTMRFICGLSVYKTTMALMTFYILRPFQKTSEQFLNEIFLFNITCFGPCQGLLMMMMMVTMVTGMTTMASDKCQPIEGDSLASGFSPSNQDFSHEDGEGDGDEDYSLKGIHSAC